MAEGRAGKTTDAMLDHIGDLMKERDLLRSAIAAANARYERSANEEPSFAVATDMYIELAGTSGSTATTFAITLAAATAVLAAHQRVSSEACSCSWAELGKSHPEHQAMMLADALAVSA